MGQYQEKRWRCMRSIRVVGVLFVSLAAVGAAAAAAADLEKPSKPDVDHRESSAQNGSAPNGLISTVTHHLIFSQLQPLLLQGHVWPEMKLDWRLVLGSVIGFFGAALGSIGGVGGGGIFVPMLTLIIGFDAKSSTAISKCMIMGAAASTVYYNLPLKHPTLDMPIIDYDLALLFQPMLMLGISIGVAFNVIFADWMVTLLLIVLFLVTSTRAFFKGIETWRKETIMKEAAQELESSSCSKLNDDPEMLYQPFTNSPTADGDPKLLPDFEVSVLDTVYWRELAVLLFVWVAFLLLQIVKTYAPTCSADYWVFNSLQVPIAVGATVYEGVGLYTGRRVIASRGPGRERMNWKVHQLFFYCCCGILAGVVGGLLGLGGGFILGPLFLELGLPPQVASATSTFVMVFSASMSVAQNYLLNRFPIGYAAYFILVATIAAVIGQHAVRKLLTLFGRASLIIFILALTIFISAISLGSVGISDMVEKLERHEHMGFESLC